MVALTVLQIISPYQPIVKPSLILDDHSEDASIINILSFITVVATASLCVAKKLFFLIKNRT